jgi:hypothetical protein
VTLYSFFENIFFILQAEYNNIVVMAVFIVLHALAAALRLCVFMGYRGQNIWLAADLHPSKSLKVKSDASAIRSHLLRRVAAAYISAAEKNAPRVPAQTIVEKHVLELALAGWRYSGINLWVNKLENGLILLGIVLALIFPQYAVVYGLLAVSGFIILKLAAALFDCDTARQLLIADIRLYVERELGQFFAGHTAAAVRQFKEGMSEAIDRQSALLRGAVEKLSADLSPALSNLQCLSDLPVALGNMLESNKRYALHHEAFIAQGQIIKDTQSALEKSLASYETTLQNLVQTMGGGLGAFIELHGQNAARGLTTVLQDHMDRVAVSNQETVSAINSLAEQLAAQSRDVSVQLRELHDHISEP